MCTALKEDFVPYLDMIIPLLLKTANQEVEAPSEEAIDDFLDMSDEEVGVSVALNARTTTPTSSARTA